MVGSLYQRAKNDQTLFRSNILFRYSRHFQQVLGEPRLQRLITVHRHGYSNVASLLAENVVTPVDAHQLPAMPFEQPNQCLAS